MNFDSKNIVIVFSQPIDKAKLKYDDLRNLIDGETAELLNIPHPLAPVVFNYTRAGLEIAFIDNNSRLQVQTSASENAKASREFIDIVGRILTSLPNEHPLSAYGFNFNSLQKNASKKVHEIINLPSQQIEVQQFTFIPKTSIMLSYTRDEGNYFLSFQDSGPALLVLVNVHFDIDIQIDGLKELLADKYSAAVEHSQQLIREAISQ